MRTVIFSFISAILINGLCANEIASFLNRLDRFYMGNISNRPELHFSPFFLFFVAVVLCFIFIAFELSAFNNRRFLDTAYSLPISRGALVVSHLAAGYVQTAIVLTVCFAVTAAQLSRVADEIVFGELLLYYLLMLVMLLGFYCFVALAFSLANNTFDGIGLSAMWSFLPLIFFSAVGERTGSLEFIIEYTNPYTFLMELTSLFEHRINKEAAGFGYIPIYILVSLAFAALFIFLTAMRYSRRRTERAGEISGHPLAYRTVIPVYALSFGILLGNMENPVIIALMLCGTIIGFVVFKRGFKFNKFDFIEMGAIGIATALLVILDKLI